MGRRLTYRMLVADNGLSSGARSQGPKQPPNDIPNRRSVLSGMCDFGIDGLGLSHGLPSLRTEEESLKLVFDSISGSTEARIQQNQDFRW